METSKDGESYIASKKDILRQIFEGHKSPY